MLRFNTVAQSLSPDQHLILKVMAVPLQLRVLQAYHRLAKEFHPDKNPEEGERVRNLDYNLFSLIEKNYLRYDWK